MKKKKHKDNIIEDDTIDGIAEEALRKLVLLVRRNIMSDRSIEQHLTKLLSVSDDRKVKYIDYLLKKYPYMAIRHKAYLYCARGIYKRLMMKYDDALRDFKLAVKLNPGYEHIYLSYQW